VRTVFEIKHVRRARDRARIGLSTRKTTPERAAVGWFATEIEKLAGAPLDADVLELIAPFLEKPIDDRDTLGHCRKTYKDRLKTR
jgi:hypothetical protein